MPLSLNFSRVHELPATEKVASQVTFEGPPFVPPPHEKKSKKKRKH